MYRRYSHPGRLGQTLLVCREKTRPRPLGLLLVVHMRIWCTPAVGGHIDFDYDREASLIEGLAQHVQLLRRDGVQPGGAVFD